MLPISDHMTCLFIFKKMTNLRGVGYVKQMINLGRPNSPIRTVSTNSSRRNSAASDSSVLSKKMTAMNILHPYKKDSAISKFPNRLKLLPNKN